MKDRNNALSHTKEKIAHTFHRTYGIPVAQIAGFLKVSPQLFHISSKKRTTQVMSYFDILPPSHFSPQGNKET